MSGFFGVFSPGGNIDNIAFTQMQDAIHRDGYDELSTHVDDNIAMGHLMLRVTKESIYDKQPLKSSCGKYLLVGHFRLDYRDELGDKLGLTQKELEITPDSVLVMLSYQKWEDQCVHHLEGDWAFVLYDYIKQKIFLAKDATGISAIYYCHFENSFLFSSDPTVFSKCAFYEPEIDEIQLMFLSVHGLKIEKGSTLIKGLNSLINGSSLIVDSKTHKHRHNYFCLTDIGVTKRFKDEKDLFFEVKNTYAKAIKSRIECLSEIGLFLSSGLDSMSVLALASTELRRQNKLIHTFTSIPSSSSVLSPKEKACADESDLVKSVVQKTENVHAHFCSFEEFSFSKIDFNGLAMNPFNPNFTGNTFWINGIFQKGKEIGVKSFLTGQMGNFTLSSDGYFVHADLFLNFKFKVLFSDLWYSKQQKIKNFLVRIKTRIIDVFKFQYLLFKNYNKLFKSSYFSQLGLFGYFTYQKHLDRFYKRKGEWIPNFFSPFNQRQIRLTQLDKYLYHGNIDWYLYSLKNTLSVSDPTADKRLIELSLSIDELNFVKNGIPKYLYKKVFYGLVDEIILINTHLKVQSFDLLQRIQKDEYFLKSVESIIESVNMIQLKEVVAVVNDAQLLFNAPLNDKSRSQLSLFLHKISVVNFISKFKTRNFNI